MPKLKLYNAADLTDIFRLGQLPNSLWRVPNMCDWLQNYTEQK